MIMKLSKARIRKLIKMLVINRPEIYSDISANHHIKSHISTSYSQVRVKEDSHRHLIVFPCHVKPQREMATQHIPPPPPVSLLRTLANFFSRELGLRDVVMMILGSCTPAQRYSSSTCELEAPPCSVPASAASRGPASSHSPCSCSRRPS